MTDRTAPAADTTQAQTHETNAVLDIAKTIISVADAAPRKNADFVTYYPSNTAHESRITLDAVYTVEGTLIAGLDNEPNMRFTISDDDLTIIDNQLHDPQSANDELSVERARGYVAEYGTK